MLCSDPIPIGGTVSDPTDWRSHQAHSCSHTHTPKWFQTPQKKNSQNRNVWKIKTMCPVYEGGQRVVVVSGH